MPNVHIPSFLKHLKINDKGYPIPFFVAYVDGKPDFRLLDPKKQHYCIHQKLCAICGKKLFKDSYYFISGPIGYTNGVSTDPAMHRECAEYSINVCPHLHFEKSERRDKGIEHLKNEQDCMLEQKPPMILLVKAHKFKDFRNPANEGTLIRFIPASYEIFVYENGLLTKSLMPTV